MVDTNRIDGEQEFWAWLLVLAMILCDFECVVSHLTFRLLKVSTTHLPFGEKEDNALRSGDPGPHGSVVEH